MDRRRFITASLGVGAVAYALPPLICYGLLNDSRLLVLIDPTLRESRAHAARLGSENRRVIAVGEDIGALWHAHLRHWNGAFKGMLRPSDCFVLRTFSTADARAFRSVRAGPRSIAFAIDVGPPLVRIS